MKPFMSVSSITKNWFFLMTSALCVASLMFPELALAEEKTLPYEGGLKTLEASLTGTVPTVISLAGIIGCGAMLIFGGEISGFMRTMVFIVLVVAILVQATNLIDLMR